MAVSTILRRALRRIAGAITEYAKKNKWTEQDYWIYYQFNPDWDRLHILFVAKAFDLNSEFKNYASVQEFLTEVLADEPHLQELLGLVVRSKRQVDEGGIYSIGSDYREYYARLPVGH